MRPILLAALLVPAPALAQVTPGQWTTTLTFATVDMPGAPPAIINMMRGRKFTTKHCLTAAEAARGPQDMLKSDKSCHFARYAMTGGKVSSEMICTHGGQTITMTTAGTFTSTSFAATSRTVTTGTQPMTTTTSVVGTRTGDCK